MQDEERFEEALMSPDPLAALRNLVRSLSSEGYEKGTVFKAFEEFRSRLREAGREDDEDVVMDAMDMLVGWCAQHARLLPDEDV